MFQKEIAASHMSCVPMKIGDIRVPLPSTWYVKGDPVWGSLARAIRAAHVSRVLGPGARLVNKPLLQRLLRANPEGFDLPVFTFDDEDAAFALDDIDVDKYDMGRYIVRRRLHTYRFVPVRGDVLEYRRERQSQYVVVEGIDVGLEYYDLPKDLELVRKGLWVHCLNRNIVINLSLSPEKDGVLWLVWWSYNRIAWVHCGEKKNYGPGMVHQKPCPPGSRRNPVTKRCRRSKILETKAVKKIQKFVDLHPADQSRVVNASDKQTRAVAKTRKSPKGHAKDFAGKIAKGIDGTWWESKQVRSRAKTVWRWKPYRHVRHA